jgi:glycyl-tRNA synthetase beta chain
VEKLTQLVFHQKLGSVWDKSQRVAELAKVLCSVTGADPQLVERAALLSKMDLVTETVGEFPELQGRIGRQLYRFSQGLYVGSPGPSGFENLVQAPTSDEQAWDRHDAQRVADAIEEHYLPTGPDSPLPKTDIGLTLALADKLDTLVCFWAINEKPTGSSDPYALRRAALGLIRIVEGATYRLPMRYWAVMAYEVFAFRWQAQFGPVVPLVKWDVPLPDNRGQPGEDILRMLKFAADGDWGYDNEKIGDFLGFFGVIAAYEAEEGEAVGEEHQLRFVTHHAADVADSFIAFLADRLKVQLRDQGKRHDLVDAVFALGDDDLVRIVARVEALDAFLKTEDGANLLAGYKRAANILTAEEKKQKWSADEAKGEVDASKLLEPAEKALYDALARALPDARAAVEKEEFAQAMKALSALRAPVDAFFEKVMVNADDAMLRRNRLLLLSRLREALSAVADFSKIEG